MLRAFVMGAFFALTVAGPLRAQIYPPAPGVPLPQGYVERMQEDRTAFQFKRAWMAETRRVQEQRRLWQKGMLAATQAPRVQGTKRVPVLAGAYSNTGNPDYSLSDLQKRLFDGPNPNGTVTEYYQEISRGNINLTGDVWGSGPLFFKLPQGDTYYEGPNSCNGLCGSAKTGEFLKSVLDGVDPQVDFAEYDNDGPDGVPNSGDDDGFVDFVAFVHPEAGGECGNNNMWSHRWVYEGWWGTSYETDDDAARGGKIRVSDYTVQPLLSCDGSSLIEIGVYAHEFGHAFGLPDLYDTNAGDGDSQGIGNWGLMAAGSWGGDGQHPQTPAHMCAWSKEQLGWVDPVTLCAPAEIDLAPVQSSGEVIRLYPHGDKDTEYFLLEYREQTGFDAYLPVSGLAVWHIDNDNPGNGNENKKLVDLEEADGLKDLDNAANRGDSGDLFPGRTNNKTFDRNSNPNSRAADGLATGISLTDIGFGGAGMTFTADLTECRLRVQGLAVDDEEWGDNAGNLSPSEDAELTVCAGNEFDFDRYGVSMSVSSRSEKVTLENSTAELGTVAAGAPQCAVFQLAVDGSVVDGEELIFDVTLTADGGYVSEHQASLFAGQYVLIVEDNGIFGYVNDYVTAVEEAGYTPVVYDTETLSSPSAGTLRSSLAAVWFTGPDSFSTLKPEEQETLRRYLEQGGTLLLSGDDIGYDLVQDGSGSDRFFYETWLKARFVTDVSDNTTLQGVNGHPITEGLSYNLSAIKSKWPSIIEPVGGSEAALEYVGGGVGAVSYEGEYNLLYTAFNFEAGAPSERNALMERFLARHVLEDRTPPSLALTSTPEAMVDACDSVTITWDASDETGVEEVSIALYQAGVSVGDLAVLAGNPGSYTWDTDRAGADLSLKVAARDASGLQRVESTPTFEVVDDEEPQVTVVFPNGGENLEPGEPIEIAWNHSDCTAVTGAKVWVSMDDGATWDVVGETEGASSLAWTPPLTPTAGLWVRVEVTDAVGLTAEDGSDAAFSAGVDDQFAGATKPVLLQNRPNPFSDDTGTTWLLYLPEAVEVEIVIYDLQGRMVKTLDHQAVEGQQEVSWDGTNTYGEPVPGGIYFVRLHSAVGGQTRKLVRL